MKKDAIKNEIDAIERDLFLVEQAIEEGDDEKAMRNLESVHASINILKEMLQL